MDKVVNVLFAGLKGGVGKTTSCWLMACELARRGARVLAVDGDPISQTLTDSHRRAVARGYTIPFRVLSWPTSEGFAEGVAAEALEMGAQWVLMDTGGDLAGPFNDAGLLADEVIAPVAPTEPDLRRLAPTRKAVGDLATLSRRNPGFAALLVRTQSRAADVRTAREFLERSGWPLMAAHVPDHAAYRRAFGHVVSDTGAYVQVVDEMLAGRPADQQEDADA